MNLDLLLHLIVVIGVAYLLLLAVQNFLAELYPYARIIIGVVVLLYLIKLLWPLMGVH